MSREGTVLGPRASGVVEREIDGRFALLQQATSEVVVLNETASDLWRLVADGDLSMEDVLDRLAAAYATEPSAIRDEVEAALADLAAKGFVASAAG